MARARDRSLCDSRRMRLAPTYPKRRADAREGGVGYESRRELFFRLLLLAHGTSSKAQLRVEGKLIGGLTEPGASM